MTIDNKKKSFIEPLKEYGDLVIRNVPMPKDCNQGGTVFGGWLLSQIDLGASISAIYHCKGSVVTRNIKNVDFIKPIYTNSLIDVYTQIRKVGITSITLDVNVFMTTPQTKNQLVAKADIVFVKISKENVPIPILNK